MHNTCETYKTWRWAIAILLDMPRRFYVVPNIVSVSATLHACAKGLEWRQALASLSLAKQRGLRFEYVTSSKCGPVAHNAAIASCEGEESWPWALALMRDLENSAVRGEEMPDVVTFNSALAACGAGHEWQIALDLFKHVQHCRSLQPNLVTHHAVAQSCLVSGRWRLGLQLISNLLCSSSKSPGCSIGLEVNVVTFNCAMNSFLLFANPKHRIFGAVDDSFDVTGELSTSWNGTLQILSELQQRALHPDLVSVNSAMSAFAQARYWSAALHWFWQVQDVCNIAVDTVTGCALLGARCPREVALSLLEQMRCADLEQNIIAQSEVVSSCERDGDPRGAPQSLWTLGSSLAPFI